MSTIITVIRDSPYGMPIVQSVHLVGLTLLLGAMLVLNFRLAGLVMSDWPLAWLARQLRPWAVGALVLVVLSGIVMFALAPAKYLSSNPFRIKMIALGLATLFQFGVVGSFISAEPGFRWRALNVIAAGLALSLWFCVGWAGRAIAFVP